MMWRSHWGKAAMSAICLSTLAACSTAMGAGPTAPAAQAAFAPAPAIIPQPAELRRMDGVFVLSDGARVGVPAGDAGARAAAERFADLLSRTRRLSVRIVEGSGEVTLTRADDRPAEGYRLTASPSAVSIAAKDDAGLQYGLVTLWQLATQTDAGPAPIQAVSITDAPRFAWRGVMLDSARHYQSPEFIKGFLDWMVVHKLNTFHWHLVDDQAWRVEIHKYPRLTEVGGWRVPEGHAARVDIDPATGKPRLYGGIYTQDQVREIVAYAAARGITVVPEIDLPGHASAAIVAYPELGVRDAPNSAIPEVPSDWGVYPNLFNTDASTIAFLRDVLTELTDLFPGPYFHLGGDEAVKDQWKASPSTQAHMRELGITDENVMQGWFMGQLQQTLTQHGKRMVGWDEILEGGVQGGVGQDAIVMSWRGADGAVTAAREGHDTILSPAPLLYLDNRVSDNDPEPGRETVMTPHAIWAFEPVSPELTPEQARHVIGVQANIWTEHMIDERRVEYMAFPRLASLAEVGWSTAPGRTWIDFAGRLTTELARYRMLGIDYSPYALDQTKAPPPPDGSIRYDHQMTQCTGGLVLTLIDDAPVRGPRPAFTVDLFNPCWKYVGADLTHGATLEAAVGQVPFNFQIGRDRANVKVRPAATPSGEFEVRIDSCEGPTALTLSLEEAQKSDALTTLSGRLPAMPGRHDLCLTFTQHGDDPIWAVDWAKVTLGEAH